MNGGRPKELARRSGSDGVEVSLRWRRADDRFTVVVTDHWGHRSFSIPAARGNALEVFYHPYAYITAQGREAA